MFIGSGIQGLVRVWGFLGSGIQGKAWALGGAEL